MRTEQSTWTRGAGWSAGMALPGAHLVLAFGGVDIIHRHRVYGDLRERYPQAHVLMASTAGEIRGSEVLDESIVATALSFDRTPIRVTSIDTTQFDGSAECGKAITAALAGDDLVHILVISDGTHTNGDELVRGIQEELPDGVIVTGGLAADNGRFTHTYVGMNEVARSHRIAAVGFYGPHLRVGHGSQGGWDVFGPERIVTSSRGNVLLTLDGNNALDLYKKYLGERATELPGAALLFPLSILLPDGSRIVRTILSIDERDGSMTFAGDIPQGARVQFMLANFDRLVDGASDAATSAVNGSAPEAVLMISCVGRKLVLGHRVEEETGSVCERFGTGPVFFGFYSNGEISPTRDGVHCRLHNQTMTITTYSEAPGS